MTPVTAVVDVAGRQVVVREMTVAEIRAWLDAVSQGDINLVDAALFEEFSIADIPRMTDLTMADIDAMTPSQVRLVQERCKEVNGDFFGMRARTAEVGLAVARQG